MLVRWAGEGGLLGAFADRYQIQREVGHGAMARVYLARDLQYNRDVAIKMLNPELSAALGPERFLREIDILARLNHPHILPLFDSGEARGSLFYVMPYVAGESLRQRLRRETQLRIEDAIAITRDVAGALDYAHRQGIVHRDIKPENILMSEGLALVADFGIARAITLSADDDRITQSGVSPGTPPYMSPEQASGDGVVDGRSDLYALGCVLYEMLAGQPPFTGPTTQAILARHLADQVPPLRTVRKTVPVGVEQAVLKALEKVPADRFATVESFSEALASQKAEPTGPDWVKLGVQIAAGVAVAAVIWFSLQGGVRLRRGGAGDSTRIALLPIERAAGVESSNDDQLLQDAFAHWRGIEVVDPFQVKDAMTGLQGRTLTSADVRNVASALGAGRYVRTDIAGVADSIRVHAELYDANRGTRLRDGTVRFPRDSSRATVAFGTLAEALLFGPAGPGAGLDSSRGTNSFLARREFARALDSVYTWNLPAADSALNAATAYDPQYSEAHLWLAQVRFWSNAVTARWRSSAERAAAGRTRLPNRDQALSDALLAFGRDDPVSACKSWQMLTERAQYDFTGWYGLAACLTQDEAVVPDAHSPSGWRFRSSYYRATKAYERAFQLLPSIHKALSAGSYATVRQVLRLSGSANRTGHGIPPDTTTYWAYPSWQGDTLSFVPFPQQRFSTTAVLPPTAGLAVRNERRLFHDIAIAWISAFPRSPEAMEALALSLELLGDRAALDTLRRARALATTPDERLRFAGTEVWMGVKFSAPSDSVGLLAARILADSLLRGVTGRTARLAPLLSSLAALTGRASLAADLSRHPAFVDQWEIPTPLASSGGPLLVFAALGGPIDSLREFEYRVDSVIDNQVSSPTSEDARVQWLGRPAALAFPHYRFNTLRRLPGGSYYLLDVEGAFVRGDTATVRHVLKDIQSARRFAFVSDLTFDALYPEAWLLDSLGDYQAAVARIDPTLGTLATSAPQAFWDPGNAGALVQTMMLRADLATKVGDAVAAARWGRAVSLLWSDADAFLQPAVRRMERLARGSSGGR